MILFKIAPLSSFAARVAAGLVLSLLASLVGCSGGKNSEDNSPLALLFLRGGGSAISVPTGSGSQPPTLNTIATGTSDAPAGKGKLSIGQITFQKPVSGQTAITVFVGSQDMKLLPDATVVNSLEHKSMTFDQGPAFEFLVAADRRYRVIVVARNELGLSSKEFGLGHPRLCAAAAPIPAAIGDCNAHCIHTTRAGNLLILNAKYGPDPMALVEDYYLDLYVYSIQDNLVEVVVWPWVPDPSPIIETPVQLDLNSYGEMCVRTESSGTSAIASNLNGIFAIPLD